MRAEGVPARGVPGPALFRSHPPFPDRAGAARGLAGAFCAGEPSPTADGRIQIHQLRPPAGQRAGSFGRALAATPPSRPRRDTGAVDMGFLTHLYTSAMQNPYDVLWNVIGFGGQAIFGIRMLIQ